MKEEPRWQLQAACRGLTPLFFPERGDEVELARAVCRTCPVQTECLDLALSYHLSGEGPSGTW